MRKREISNTSRIIYISILVALSVLGALIKPFGTTIAFDSMPGFFGALLLGPLAGGIIGALGHLFSALTSGFPLTIPVHFFVAFTMCLSCMGFGMAYIKFNKYIAIVVGVLLNAPISIIISGFLMSIIGIMSLESIKSFFLLTVGPLSIVAAINIVLAVVVFEILKTTRGIDI